MIVPKEVLALRNVATMDETREALRQIHISENCESAIAEATDGRVLLRMKWKLDVMQDQVFPTAVGDDLIRSDEKEGLLPVEEAKRIEQSLKASKAPLPFSKQNFKLNFYNQKNSEGLNKKFIKALTHDAAFHSPSTDRDFPHTENALPKPEIIKSEITFDVLTLSKLVDTLKKAGASEFTLGIIDSLGAVKITSNVKHPFIGIDGAIMPKNIKEVK